MLPEARSLQFRFYPEADGPLLEARNPQFRCYPALGLTARMTK